MPMNSVELPRMPSATLDPHILNLGFQWTKLALLKMQHFLKKFHKYNLLLSNISTDLLQTMKVIKNRVICIYTYITAIFQKKIKHSKYLLVFLQLI